MGWFVVLDIKVLSSQDGSEDGESSEVEEEEDTEEGEDDSEEEDEEMCFPGMDGKEEVQLLTTILLKRAFSIKIY